MRCHIIPPYLLEALATSSDPAIAACGNRTRAVDLGFRDRRHGSASLVARPKAAGDADWEIHDVHHGTSLPGDLVRTAGDADSGDVTLDEAAVGLAETLALLTDLGRDSYDDRGATVVASVHYDKDYDNAFWDGTQLVFGDGDGTVFGRFTKPIDVLGHELSHAVTQFTANLTYSGQSGALNESISDVLGSCVKQRHLGQDAAAADWLIGEGIFVEGIKGRALRSMSEPGTAYDDPALGKDPQVGHLDDYVDTTDDNGGVHLNSGIPNRAFQLAATAIGGTSWEGAGRIWYAALTSDVPASADFARFAQACVDAAGENAEAVRSAWHQVGVDGDSRPSTPAPATKKVMVTRSGGIAGMTRRGEVDLDSDDPRAAAVSSLVHRIDFTSLTVTEQRGADRFVYEFSYASVSTQMLEQDLTDDLRRLANLVLE